jgi:6-phosphogluconolactonase
MQGRMLKIADDAEALAVAAEAALYERIRAYEAKGSPCHLALSGGTTPRPILERLAQRPIAWSQLHVWFVDERCVPPEHPESNFQMVKAALLDRASIPAQNVHRMRGEAPDADAAAAEYGNSLPPALSIALLGVGEDGHFASIFPGSALLDSTARAAAVHDSPKPPPDRITLTPRVLIPVKDTLVVVSGRGKAQAVARALDPRSRPEDVPSTLFRGSAWFIDRAAASLLEEQR